MYFKIVIKYDYVEQSFLITSSMALLSALFLPIVKNCSVSQAVVTHCSTMLLKYIYFLLSYTRYFRIHSTAIVLLHNIRKNKLFHLS